MVNGDKSKALAPAVPIPLCSSENCTNAKGVVLKPHAHCPVPYCLKTFKSKTDEGLVRIVTSHYNESHRTDLNPAPELLVRYQRKMCPMCEDVIVGLRSTGCTPCTKGIVAPVAPMADNLPQLPKDLSHKDLQVNLSEVIPPRPGDHGGMPAPLRQPSTYNTSLMDVTLCGVPTMPRIPKSMAAPFAALWSSLISSAMTSGLESDWVDVFRFPKCILLSPQRGGKRISQNRSYTNKVSARLDQWREGPEGRAELWSTVTSLATSRRTNLTASLKPQSLEERVVALLRSGDTKKAIQALTSAPIADVTEANAAKMEALHPAGKKAIPVPAAQLPDAPPFSTETVKAALASFNPCAAGGLFGYKPALLQQCMATDSFHFANTITDCVNMLAQGRAPDFLQPFLAGGNAIALKKGEDAIRPLCSGDPLRRLVAKCFCLAGKDDIDDIFKGMNYGVGCPGGTEVVVHSLRDILKLHSVQGSTKGLLKIDFKNAFNLVERAEFIKAACARLPGISRWTHWCYDQPSILLYGGKFVLWSTGGTQQGDPLAPFYYCCPLLRLIQIISELEPDYNKWYMDDGGIVAELDILQRAWDIICREGPGLGMYPNIIKTEFTHLDPTNTSPCPIVTHIFDAEGNFVLAADGTKELAAASITLVPTAEIQMLGAPLGSSENTLAYVRKKLNDGKTGKILTTLCDFNDEQVASFLLRTSYCSVKATSIMRSVPPAEWKEEAIAFDGRVRKAAEQIHGLAMTTEQWMQASTSTSMGGLSLRSCEEHAIGAYAASWHESKVTVGKEGESWTMPPCIVDQPRQNQKSASHKLDVDKFNHLLSISDEPGRANLIMRKEPHANAWVSAVPSYTDGFDYTMSKQLFNVNIRRLLRAPVHADGALCPFCMQSMNQFGDHALCCGKGGDTITRHNRIRNACYKFADHGGMQPVLEKQGILGDDKDKINRRPGDVAIPLWASGKGLAIDVAIISSTAKSRAGVENPVEAYARVKHSNYDAQFVGVPWDFAPLVFSTSGEVNNEGEGVLKQLFRFAAKQSNMRYSVYCSKGWSYLSITLQRAVAQSILNRRPPKLEDGDKMRVRVEPAAQ